MRLTGERESGRDVVQEAFTRAVRGRSQFDRRSSPELWVSYIVVEGATARRPSVANSASMPFAPDVSGLELDWEDVLLRAQRLSRAMVCPPRRSRRRVVLAALVVLAFLAVLLGATPIGRALVLGSRDGASLTSVEIRADARYARG